MATGYTHPIIQGDGISLREYLLSCARACGPAWGQRDAPMSAPLQTVVEPGSYHLEQLDEARDALARLEGMSDAERLHGAYKGLTDAICRYNLTKERRSWENGQYAKMAREVEGWSAPTPDHEHLKKFALSQIEISLDTYDLTPVLHSDYEHEAWYKRELEEARYNVTYHTSEYEKECEGCAVDTAWLQAFVESLPAEEEK